MSGKRQHFLPAVLIGGFGDQSALDLRDAEVCWRRRGSDEVRLSSAEYIGWRSTLYRLREVLPGIDPDVVDKVWDVVEPRISTAVRRFETGSDAAADHELLRDFASMMGVRHYQFGDAVNRWRAELGMPLISGDQITIERVNVLRNSVDLIKTFRWRLLHSPLDAPRFILNDLGWTYIGQPGRSGRGLFFPLNSRVAALAWIAPDMVGGFDHQILRPNWVRWLNAATWTSAPEFVVGHPTDQFDLAQQYETNRFPMWATLRGAFRDVVGEPLVFDEV